MGHSYESSKKLALRLIIVLAIITVVEVTISLLGKGHIVEGFTFSPTIIRILMVVFSLVKAFYIVGEFMHLKYEINGMPKTVLIPLILLPWGIIAFLADGSSWLDNKNEMATDSNRYIKHQVDESSMKHDSNSHETKHIEEGKLKESDHKDHEVETDKH